MPVAFVSKELPADADEAPPHRRKRPAVMEGTPALEPPRRRPAGACCNEASDADAASIWGSEAHLCGMRATTALDSRTLMPGAQSS